MEEQKNRVAVFIDGENISHTHAQQLFDAASDFGEVVVSRVYGGVKNIDQWEHQPFFKRMLTPSGKNATDIIICVDMIQMACTGDYDVVVIGSGDKDFVHAAETIRRMGLTVIGLNDAQPAMKLRLACHRYICLEDHYVNAEEAILSHLLQQIDLNGSVPLRAFNTYIKEATGYCVIDIRDGSWIDFIENRAEHLQLTERGPHYFIERAAVPEPEPVTPAIVVPCSLSRFQPDLWLASTAVAQFVPATMVPLDLVA